MRRGRLPLFVFALLALAIPANARRRSVTSPPPSAESRLTAEEWLKKHAIAFATEQPETGFDDLRGLSAIVGNARIVSLGEATHGTHEFFAMKHRMLEYLVENMGFTVFAIEAALPECDAINDYVLNGTGDPKAALIGQHFLVWDAHEVLDMILWMRNYNLRRGSKPAVYFHGFDMQYSQVAINKASAYLERVDAAGAPAITALWKCFAPYAANSFTYLAVDVAARTSCHANVSAAYSAMESKRAEYVAHSSANEYETMLRYARIIVQNETLAGDELREHGSTYRDSSMAENATWLANVAHPGEKLVLWAHNYHVGIGDPTTMGTVLRQNFPGEQMVVFGFAFDHGSFNAFSGDWRPFFVAPFNGGFDNLFRTTGHARWIADFRRIESEDAKHFFSIPHSMWFIAEIFRPTAPLENYRDNALLPGKYDAIIWFAETTQSKLL